MAKEYLPRSLEGALSRRDFLWLLGAAGSAAALPTLLSGCAVDPVTGQKTLVGLSEEQEMSLDKRQSPQQFSADLGAVQDGRLNRYVEDVGSTLWGKSHRPRMPYSARVLNANYVNAYTFPGAAWASPGASCWKCRARMNWPPSWGTRSAT